MATTIEALQGSKQRHGISETEGRLPKASPGATRAGRLPKASPADASARGAALPGPQWSAGERSEPERNEGPGSADRGGNVASATSAAPNPEVLEKPKRRQFTAEFKRRFLREADRCSRGQLGALLRREGLYSSHQVA